MGKYSEQLESDLREWAQRIQARNAIQEAHRDAIQKADNEEKAKQNRQHLIKRLNEFLAGMDLPLVVEEDVIRFGDYELRAGGTRSSGFGLRVWAPAPYDIRAEPWDDVASVKKGEMADANYDISYSSELAEWLLDPKTNFPPEQPKPVPTATEETQEIPAYVPPPPPPSTAEQLLSLIKAIISEEVGSRFEQVDYSIERLGSTIDASDARSQKRIEDQRYRSNELQNDIDDLRHRK